MTSYKELGLVNTREMFKKAVKEAYAVPAYNFNNLEQLQAIIQACVETKSPVIIQVSSGARKYANANLLKNMAKGAVEYAHELGYDIPICSCILYSRQKPINICPVKKDYDKQIAFQRIQY